MCNGWHRVEPSEVIDQEQDQAQALARALTKLIGREGVVEKNVNLFIKILKFYNNNKDFVYLYHFKTFYLQPQYHFFGIRYAITHIEETNHNKS